MEVGLRREGLRALVFCFMCICFCVMLFLSTQPTMRNASRWYVSERLKLAQLKLVTSKDEAFSALMDIAARSREFYPLSSDYFDDPLSKVLHSRPPLSCWNATLTYRHRHDICCGAPTPRRRCCLPRRSSPLGLWNCRQSSILASGWSGAPQAGSRSTTRTTRCTKSG